MPFVIHVSGAPGTGKTTLGEEIKAFFGDAVCVKDTDEFIQHHTDGGKRLLELELDPTVTMEEYNSVWRSILTSEISKFMKRTVGESVIVLVGLLDNFGGEGAEYYLEDADVKIFLTIDTAVLLEQYYTRVCKAGVKTPEYWGDVAEGRKKIASSKNIVDSYEWLKNNHARNHYDLVPRDDAPALLKKIIARHLYVQ
jgi:adenylate kinase family enzyme